MNTDEAIQAFLKSRRAKNLKPSAVKWYEVTLKPLASAYPVLPDDPDTVEDFLISRRSGDERRHGYYRAIRALYRFLKRRYGIENIIPMMDAPKREKKLPRPITIDALDQLLAYPHPKRIEAALLFMADSGCRVGETSRLEIADLIETEWSPVAVVTGKTGTRFVPISVETYRSLKDILPFKISANWLCKLVSRAFKEANVKGTAHSLRHTFATYWDGDESILQKVMGHSNIATTQIYRQLRVKKMCEQHRQYSPMKMVYAKRQYRLPI